MKKKWIWICIVLIIAVGIYVFFPTEKLILDRNNEALADNFSAFQEINEQYKSDIFKVSLVGRVVVSSASSPNPIRIFSSVNDQLILDCDAKIDENTKFDTRYYKIDKAGSVTDSLYVAYQGYSEQFIDSFMVYTSEKDAYYNTWPLNGDTTRHQVVELNADLSWEDERLKAKIKSVKAKAKYYFLSTAIKENVWYLQVYFYTDQKWYLLWQKMPGYTEVLDEDNASRYRNVVFRSGEVSFEIPEDVKLLHFHQQEKIKYYHVVGGGHGGFSVYNWRGLGFFETGIAGRVFEFMVPKLVVEKEKHNGYKPSLYIVSEPGSSTKLYNPAFYHSPNGFSFYAPEAKKLFLIKIK